jgi:hypothetical protein
MWTKIYESAGQWTDVDKNWTHVDAGPGLDGSGQKAAGLDNQWTHFF